MSAPTSIRLVGISGSLRKQSDNSGALRAIASLLPEGLTLRLADLAPLPFYNDDVEKHGLPESVQKFRAEVAASDALIFAVPEYNYSLSGALKNAMEWLSRSPNSPANGKSCAVLGASVSPLGTAGGQFHFRHVCVSLNMMLVNMPHVDINNAKDKFDGASVLIHQPTLDSLRLLLDELRILTLRLRTTQSLARC